MTAAVIGANLSYILIAFAPPLLWLIFYLREDRHPEPKHLLILIFVGGMLSALVALAAECAGVIALTGSCKASSTLTTHPFLLFFGIAAIEEYAKYLAVKFLILKRHDFDEPVDAMIYMMTAAMGFAALENVLFLLPIFPHDLVAGFEVLTNRFVGANLLHALSSGLVGFFLARAWFSPRRHHAIAIGVIFASLLHAGFNYLILVRESSPNGTFYLILLLGIMAAMVFMDFERLKRTRIMET